MINLFSAIEPAPAVGCARRSRRRALAASTVLAGVMTLACASAADALPVGGQTAAGAASIAAAPGRLTVNQSSQNAVINWRSFNIGSNEAVAFVQPNSQSVALNRVLGADPSSILGSLTANGRVYLVNPNGILFGTGAQVNVGGLVASTLDIADSDVMAGRYHFAGSSTAQVLNQGAIHADGGYVALLGATVGNDGVISARLGSVALAAGQAVTLDVAGDGLLSVAIDKGAANALASNGGLIQADGGRVMLTAQAAGQLLHTAVNNTGVIQAQTLQNHNGTISLLADADSGSVNVKGVLDASAPHGGDGGAIETSGANVTIDSAARITTAAAAGATGSWLVDPQDFTIAADGNISGPALSALLETTNVTISTKSGADTTLPGNPPVNTRYTATPGPGDINVNQAVTWSAKPVPTILTLNADHDVIFNAPITATNGNLVAFAGHDVTVQSPITIFNGDLLMTANHNVTVVAATTITEGNIVLCAVQDIDIEGAITLTGGNPFDNHGLILPQGLSVFAGVGGTGPGAAAGTVTFGPQAPKVLVTGPYAPVVIKYNPTSYAAPTDFSPHFTLAQGATLTELMLVFPDAIKAYDGATAATLTSLKGSPSGVVLTGSGSAVFDSPSPGSNIGITFTGYTLTGPNASAYALAEGCCVTTYRTTGTIVNGPLIPNYALGPVQAFVFPAVMSQAPNDYGLENQGVRMPPVQVAEAPPAPVVAPPPVDVPPPLLPPPPPLPPKQDRF